MRIQIGDNVVLPTGDIIEISSYHLNKEGLVDIPRTDGSNFKGHDLIKVDENMAVDHSNKNGDEELVKIAEQYGFEDVGFLGCSNYPNYVAQFESDMKIHPEPVNPDLIWPDDKKQIEGWLQYHYKNDVLNSESSKNTTDFNLDLDIGDTVLYKGGHPLESDLDNLEKNNTYTVSKINKSKAGTRITVEEVDSMCSIDVRRIKKINLSLDELSNDRLDKIKKILKESTSTTIINKFDDIPIVKLDQLFDFLAEVIDKYQLSRRKNTQLKSQMDEITDILNTRLSIKKLSSEPPLASE
jgi:hypothetical protein